MEWLLVAACGFLWAIYSILKKCLIELQQINQRSEISNGLMMSLIDRVGDVDGRAYDIDQKLGSIETATSAFHDQMLRAQSRY